MSWEMYALLSGLLIFALMLIYVIRRVRFWQAEGAKMKEATYTSPPAGWFARKFRAAAGRAIMWYLGPLKIINAASLNKHRRYLVVCNHQTERDAMIMLSVLACRHVRYLVALSQIFGFREALAAWSGVIAVDHDHGPGVVVKKTVRCLQEEADSSSVIFPQGALHRTNELKREDFHSGAMLIARQVQKRSEAPLPVLPMAIYYDRNPAHRTLFHRLMNFIGFKKFRHWFGDTIYGATIVIGEAISMDEMPDDLAAGTDRIFAEIKTLSAQAEAAHNWEANKPRRWYLRPFTFLKNVYTGFFAHEILTRASAIAFNAMMATVPLLALMVSVAVQFLPDLASGDTTQSVGIGNLTVGQFEATLRLIFPEEAYRVVHEQIVALQTQSRLLTISIGLVVTFWAASSLYVAIMDALNRIYGTQETRSYVCVRLMAMLMTVIQTAILLGSMLVIVAWPQIQAVFGMNADTTQTVDIVKWTTVCFMVMLTYALWFRVGPASYQQRSLFTYGAAFGSVAFIVLCMCFRTYVQNFAAYERTYGSLGGVMALLLWYWLSSVVLLVAAEINRVIELMQTERQLPNLAQLLPSNKS